MQRDCTPLVPQQELELELEILLEVRGEIERASVQILCSPLVVGSVRQQPSSRVVAPQGSWNRGVRLALLNSNKREKVDMEHLLSPVSQLARRLSIVLVGKRHPSPSRGRCPDYGLGRGISARCARCTRVDAIARDPVDWKYRL